MDLDSPSINPSRTPGTGQINNSPAPTPSTGNFLWGLVTTSSAAALGLLIGLLFQTTLINLLYEFLSNTWIRGFAYFGTIMGTLLATVGTSSYGLSWPKRQFIVIGLCILVTLCGLVSIPLPNNPKLHTAFISDQITEDDQLFAPGDAFTKQWRMTTLTGIPRGSEMRFVSGDISAGNWRFENSIPPNTDYTIPMTLHAPLEPGCYRDSFVFVPPGSPPGNIIDRFGDTVFMQIRVAPKDHESEYNYVVFVDDLNVRDDTVFAPGTPFKKGWNFHNCGDTPITSFHARFVAGDNFQQPLIKVPTVEAHQDFQLYAEMIAPIALGKREAIYKLEDSEGKVFGSAFRVRVNITSP